MPDSARFCMSCGAELAGTPAPFSTMSGSWTVRSFKRLMPPEYVEHLLAARERPAGERRIVTILFFDVAGSTAMAEQLDPEDVMEIMNGAFEVLIQPILRYQGTLARLMGDGILAFFGAPISHEDDPERACRAALEIIDAAEGYSRILEKHRGIKGFDVRVGINTGLVVVGEVGTDLRVEYTAMGDTVNLAARMESTADPGSVRITGETRRLIGDEFATEDLGEIAIRGKAHPVRAFRLLHPVDASHPKAVEAVHFVGREAELAVLTEALDHVVEGEGGVVAITGAAGIGKTALVAEIQSRAAGNVTWAEARCASYTQSMSNRLLRDMLAGLLGIGRLALPETIEQALSRDFTRLDCPASSHDLAALVGVATSDPDHGAADPEQRRSAGLRALQAYVSARAQEAPLVLVCDDLHWSDTSSLDGIETLLGLCHHNALLVILCFREASDTVAVFHERARAQLGSRYRSITVPALERSESLCMVDRLLSDNDLPEEAVELVLRSAEGNPFFLEQVLRSLVELEWIGQGDGDIPPQISHLSIPTTMRGAIMARIDCLAPREKRILQTAAVIGRSFSPDLLSAVLDPPVSTEELARSLNELERRGFVRPVTPSASRGAPGRSLGPHSRYAEVSVEPGEREYTFLQAMTTEVSYTSLLKSHRQALHQRVASAMRDRWPGREDELAPVLAYHFEKGGVPSRALPLLITAAGRACHVHANEEAISFYQRALDLAENDDTVTDIDLAAVAEKLADVYFEIGNYRSAIERYDDARRRLPERCAVGRLLRKTGDAYEKWGKLDEADRSFEAALATVGPDDPEAGYVHSAIGIVRHRQGRDLEAVSEATLGLQIMEKTHNQRGVARVCNHLGIMYRTRGDLLSSIEFHRRARSIYSKLGLVYGIAASENNLALALHESGELEDALTHFRAALDGFIHLGNRHGAACVYDNTSQLHLDRNDEEGAIHCLEEAVSILREIGMDKSEVVREMWKSGEW